MSESNENDEKSKQTTLAVSGIPPRHPGSASSTRNDVALSGSGGSVTKTRRNSNTPSSSATNANGDLVLYNHLRSILIHPLGLPLAATFHGQDPADLKCLAQTSKYYAANHDAFDKVLKGLLENGLPEETTLTSNLAASIGESKEIPLKAKHQHPIRVPKKTVVFADILLSSNTSSRPLMLVEVGRNGNDWLRKFDQCVQYATRMRPTEQPLLLAIVTIDEHVVMKLGVFLFLWHIDEDNELQFRISLLWNSKTSNLDDASVAFGRMLRGVCDFSSWIEKREDDRNMYEYFGSNCCKVGNKVLRSYDNRYRKTERHPDIYLSPACEDIVGKVAEIIFKLPDDHSSSNDGSDDFWVPSSKRSLLVIMIPYRPGRHYATTPAAFLPVIDQLEKLHQAGFVHGDIRGFNTVFGENNDQGYLIDFDFGGEAGTMVYPRGYRVDLRDGTRLGTAGKVIYPWQDWFALGRLIFEIHEFSEPREEMMKPQKSKALQLFLALVDDWRSFTSDPTPSMITDLKEFLKISQKAGWRVKPSLKYQDEINKIFDPEIPVPREATKPRATGSPPVKKESGHDEFR